MSHPNTEMGITPVNNDASHPVVDNPKVVPAAKPATPEEAPVPQFKIVRVRKPDGTIVKVKRPITADEAAKLTASTAKPKTSAPVQAQTPLKPVEPPVAAPKSEATTAPKVDSEEEKPSPKPTKSSVTAAKVEAPKKIVSNTTESTSKPITTTTPASPAAPTKTDRAFDTVAKGARAYTGFRRFHRGSSALIGVLAPQWDIGDWQDGDEDFSDDDDDDDGDEEKYDSDDNDNETDEKHGHAQDSNAEMNSAAKDLANSTASNIASTNAQRPRVITEEKPSASAKDGTPEAVKSPVITEKEVPASDLEKSSAEKPAVVEGKSLEKRYKDWSRYIIWVIMILFPFLFMIIGILVAARDKKPYDSSLGSGTSQALTVAISVWPIIFAAIVAQSLRAYATYRVERGVRLMTLEQLVNSNSVASSIKQPFLLRRFNWITVALLVLWGLSPLATQAMQRISTTKTQDTTTPDRLRYVNTALNNSNYIAANSTAFSKVQADFNRLYSAAFLPTYTTLGSDPYNNALIPLLYNPQNTTWQDTDPTSAGEVSYYGYTSRYGIPIALVDNSSAYDYFAESSTFNITVAAAYLDFMCPPLQVVDHQFFLNTTLTLGGSQQSTFYLDMKPMSGRTNGSLALASLITLNTTDPSNVTEIDYTPPAEGPGINYTYAFTNCTFSQVFLDLNISCQLGQCYTYAARATNLANTTAHPGFVDSGSDNWVTGILGSSGATNYSVPTATDTERYLANYGSLDGSRPRINLTDLDNVTLSTKLGFLMNTFWSIGFTPLNLTSLFYNSSTEPINANMSSTPVPISYGEGVKIDSHNIYITRWGWLAALMICSAFLLLAGIFSIWWDARTVSPDVLGFASSVVRKSKYVQLPPVASAASGAERARVLGEVRVMMQDVKPSAPVGRIALGTAHPNAKRLMPGRSYR